MLDRSPVAVLHLTDCLNPGGSERQLIEQCRRIDRSRWRPLVAALHTGGTLAPELAAIDVPVAEFPLRGSLAHPNTAWRVLQLALHCRLHRVRILHAHDFYANLVALGAARLAGARLITSRRDLGHALTPAQRRVLGVACRASDRVVANAAALAASARSELGVAEARLRLVPNGIDLVQFDAELARIPRPPLPPRRHPRVITVGNMILPDKGQSDLIAAAALLAARGRALELVFVGDGRERPRLEAQARRLGVAAHFLGRRDDVPRLLGASDLACLPSWAEGSPNALIEAMAAARPTVATTVGGCPELIDPGLEGLLVPPRDPAALAEALGQLLADPARAAGMGGRARSRVARSHSLDRAAAILDRVYAELVPPTSTKRERKRERQRERERERERERQRERQL